MQLNSLVSWCGNIYLLAKSQLWFLNYAESALKDLMALTASTMQVFNCIVAECIFMCFVTLVLQPSAKPWFYMREPNTHFISRYSCLPCLSHHAPYFHVFGERCAFLLPDSRASQSMAYYLYRYMQAAYNRSDTIEAYMHTYCMPELKDSI